MINKILESVIEYSSYEDIINELIRLKKELKNNNIKYENYIDEIIDNENVSIMLERLINKYSKYTTKDNFILELTVVYRDNNKETDPAIIELMTNKTKENQTIIIEQYDNLVYKYANKYSGKGLEIEDLAQEGRLGLLKAYEIYDINRCTKFMTIALWYVRCYISKAVNNNGKLIRIPVHTLSKIKKINRFKSEFINKNGRKPTTEEISNGLNIRKEKVIDLLNIDLPIESLDRQIDESDNNSRTLAHYIPDTNPGPEEVVDRKMIKNEFYELFSKIGLSPRQMYVLTKRFGIEDGKKSTLDEIGSVLNVSRECVRQIQNKAIKKIKKSKYNDILESYVNGSIAYAIEEKSPFDFDKKILYDNEGISDSMNKKQKGLRGYFKKYDLSKLEEIVCKLPIEYQKILFKRFGDDLNQNNEVWTSSEENTYYKKIRPMIIKELGDKLPTPIKKKYATTLLEKLKIDSKEKLEIILNGMYPEYIDLIHKKYGINYDENNKLSFEEEEILSGKIMQALFRRAELLIMGKKLRPMQRRCYDENSEDDKMENNNKAMVTEPVPVNKILRTEKGIQPPPLTIYENGYPNSKEVIKEEIKKEESKELLVDIEPEEKVDNKVTVLSDLDEIVSTQMFRDFLESTQTIEDIAIMSIICGFLGKKHSINEISLFLGKSKEELLNGIIGMLKEYRGYINNIINLEKSENIQSVRNMLLDDYTKYVNKTIDSAIEKQSKKILHLN